MRPCLLLLLAAACAPGEPRADDAAAVTDTGSPPPPSPPPLHAAVFLSDTFPAADAPGRVLRITLDASGSARVGEQFADKPPLPELEGTWTASGDTLTVTRYLQGTTTPDQPLAFRRSGDSLVPLSWNPKAWGEQGPPVLRRAP